jgi:formyltetrahydrofolate deformylase
MTSGDSQTSAGNGAAHASGYVLTLTCPDRIGIVHAVSSWLMGHGCNILDSAQFSDPSTGLFAMRVHFSPVAEPVGEAELADSFAPVAASFGMAWQLWDCSIKPRVLVLVSRQDHCLHDLLYRCAAGDLAIDIVSVASNHHAAASLAGQHGVPFVYLPVNADTRAVQEDRLLELIEHERIDLVVLARYMQVLSDRVCSRYPGRIINIHHSFLPGFKGANPYRQAYDRGVKLIGATAHYVTSDLDEGPIIEQDVARVDHAKSPRELTMLGKDLERLVLARALRCHAERRVVLSGRKTIVFI